MIAKTIFVITLIVIILGFPVEIFIMKLSFKKRLMVMIILLVVLFVSAYIAYFEK